MNLKNAVESQKSMQATNAPRQLLLHCPTYLHPCRHSKLKKWIITNKVTTHFFNSLCTSVSYLSFLRSTAFSRLKIKKKNNRYLIISTVRVAFIGLLLISGLSVGDSIFDKMKKASSIQVPDLKCKNYADATRALRQKKLRIIKKGYVISNACQRQSNRILTQHPQSSMKLLPGSTISVTLTSLPLKASISVDTTPARVTKGKPITFIAKANYPASSFNWKLDKIAVNEKGNRFTVNTNNLATGSHTVTLVTYLKHRGLKLQRKLIIKTFTVIAPVTTVLSTPTFSNPKIKPIPTVRESAQAEREKILRQREIAIQKEKTRQQALKKAEAVKRERLLRLQAERAALAKRQHAERVRRQQELAERKRNAIAARKVWQAKQDAIAKKRAEQQRTSDAFMASVVEAPVDIQSTPPPPVLTTETATHVPPVHSPIEPDHQTAESTADQEVKEVGREPTQSASSEVKKNKDYGEILYNPPTHMTLNKEERIEVRIGRDPVSRQDLIGIGTVQVDTIRVSTSMTVELKGSNFKIDPLNTESRQIIDLDGYTQWAFDVTPIMRGRHNLNLSASAHYNYSNGVTGTKDIPVITRIISVKVDTAAETKSWFITNWKWIGSFIIVPFLLAYFIYSLNRHKKRRRKFPKDFNIFISYRRDDSSGYSLALYERINPVFGDENVFMDMDDIPHGIDFIEHIEKVLSAAHIVLVVIGERWIDASNDQGRRLDNPDDFVRLEIATALKRDIRVIPVLLKNARMPSAEELPDDLKALSRRNAIQIHDDQFEASVEKLITVIAEE